MRTLIAFSTVLFLALFVFLGCDGAGEKLPTAVETLAKKGGKPRPPDKAEEIPLVVTFRDNLNDGVRSDGNATYTDGIDVVEAIIMENGNFRLLATDGPRKLCLDFPNNATGTPFDNEVGKQGCDDGYITTADPDVEGGLPAMVVGSTMTSRLQVTWVMKDTEGKGFNWFLRFGLDCERNVVSANKVLITAADEDGDEITDTWTIEGGNAILCKMPVKGKPEVTFVGDLYMPFLLTLSVKQ